MEENDYGRDDIKVTAAMLAIAAGGWGAGTGLMVNMCLIDQQSGAKEFAIGMFFLSCLCAVAGAFLTKIPWKQAIAVFGFYLATTGLVLAKAESMDIITPTVMILSFVYGAILFHLTPQTAE